MEHHGAHDGFHARGFFCDNGAVCCGDGHENFQERMTLLDGRSRAVESSTRSRQVVQKGVSLIHPRVPFLGPLEQAVDSVFGKAEMIRDAPQRFQFIFVDVAVRGRHQDGIAEREATCFRTELLQALLEGRRNLQG